MQYVYQIHTLRRPSCLDFELAVRADLNPHIHF